MTLSSEVIYAAYSRLCEQKIWNAYLEQRMPCRHRAYITELHHQLFANKLHTASVRASYFVMTVLWEEITAGSRRKPRVTAAPQNGFSRLLSVFTFVLIEIQVLKSHHRHTRGELERFSFYQEALQSINVFDATYHVLCYANECLLETQWGLFISPNLDVCRESVKWEWLAKNT